MLEIPLVTNTCFRVWLSGVHDVLGNMLKVSSLQSKSACMLLIPLAQPVSKLRRFDSRNESQAQTSGNANQQRESIRLSFIRDSRLQAG